MKVILTLFAFALTMHLFSRVEADCDINGETVPAGRHEMNCIVYTCLEDGNLNALTCPVSRCENLIGYEDTDLSKPFPDCCAVPICGPSDSTV